MSSFQIIFVNILQVTQRQVGPTRNSSKTFRRLPRPLQGTLAPPVRATISQIQVHVLDYSSFFIQRVFIGAHTPMHHTQSYSFSLIRGVRDGRTIESTKSPIFFGCSQLVRKSFDVTLSENFDLSRLL